MLTSDDSRTLAQIALVVLLIIGCIAVLLPFVGALLFALVVWLCTWEAYRDHILPRLGGKPILGAALMVLALMLVFLVPTIFLAGALVRSSDVLVNHVRPLLTQGLPADPPAWFASVPLFGDMLDNFWHEIAGSRAAQRPARQELARFVNFSCGLAASLPMVCCNWPWCFSSRSSSTVTGRCWPTSSTRVRANWAATSASIW